ncbi:amino acid transporters [Longilinea arvoryzae]|uniref:Amino acid transporters n=1 Tax=Longilinea arvoryzae TaxID=360412 RepID=A0A0S7BK71_9CHLR|nr:amino acid permease [Longilinea arvoryzae]GAP14209.1 amino acid transporters [Longilinea arvoryzae]
MTQNVDTPAVDELVQSQLFVRLQRYLKIKNTSALALVGCLGLVELLPLGIGNGFWPSVDMGRTLALATGFNLVVVLLYALISAVAPYSGSDYVFTSRVLHAPLAFAAKFSSQLFLAAAAGAFAVLVAQAVLTPFLYYSSWVFQDPDLATIATSLSQPQGATIAGAIVVALVFFFSTLTPKANSRFILICVLLALLGWAAIFFQLFNANSANFATNWDLVIGEGSYAGQMPAARALSLWFGVPPQWLVLAGIPLGFLLFWGVRLPNEVSGEVKSSASKSQLLGGWFAVLVCGGLAMGSTVMVSRVISADWLAAESQLLLYSNQLKTPAMPWLPFYAALLRPNFFLFTLSTLGALAGLMAALQAFIRSFGRVWLAWTDDHMLPKLVGYIHPGSQTPLFTTLFVAILAQMGVTLAANFGVMKVLGSVMFGLICLQTFPALAAVLYPWAKRKWVKAGSANVRKANAPLLVISGLLVLAYLILMIVTIYTYPSEGYIIGGADVIILLVTFAMGLGWFAWRSRAARREGIDMARQYVDFPEE